MRAYKPKRTSLKWLKGAPDYVLCVYDNPKYADRYTVLFGGHLWDETMGPKVMYLAVNDHPTHPSFGFSQWGEMFSFHRDNCGKKIKWSDLPGNVREHIKERAQDD